MRELYQVMPFQLIDAACSFKGISVGMLRGGNRKRDVVVCRYLIAYMFLYQRWSMQNVGSLMNRHHASIVHYKKILVSGLDYIINNDLKLFSLYLYDLGIHLPTHSQFTEKCKIKTYEK